MNWFLKWYYWYKNLWDEILFIWVVNYIFQNYKLEKLYVEAWEWKWMNHWINLNIDLFSFDTKKLIVVERDSKLNFSDTLKFFWWWEVFTDQRSFPYDGWNMYLKYFKDIIKKNFVLLGWIWTPRKFTTNLLYKLTLPRAKSIIVREQKSYSICEKYTKNIALYHDFAFDVVKLFLENKSNEENKVLINLNTYINNLESIEKIKSFSKENSDISQFFVPFDMFNDLKLFENIKKELPNIQLYDWTVHPLKNTFEFLSSCRSGIWARLHFLLILHWFGKKVTPLAYQEKINKFFSN